MRRLVALVAAATAVLGVGGWPAPASATTPSWQVTSLPFSAGPQNALACAATTFCVAADGHTWRRWNGSRWSSMLGPTTGLTDAYIAAASACPSTTSCMTVGNYQDSLSSTWSSFASRWNGRYWADVALPELAAPFLRDVSCPAINACFAVGDDNLQQLAVAWNGSTWTTVADLPAVPADAEWSQLLGISCWDRNGCIALGYWWNSSTRESAPYADEWDGNVWSTTSPPPEATSADFLSALSCSSSDFCLAVGPGPLETWDGSTWSVQSSTPPSQPVAVDCVAAGDCMVDAAGDYTTDSSGNVTVQSLGTMLHFDGTTLTALPRPAAETSEQGLLYSLDCVDSDYCVATGLRPDSQRQPAMFAEVYS